MDDTATAIVILTPILSAGIYAYAWLKSRQQPIRHAARLAANNLVAPGCPVCKCRRIGNFCTKCGHAFKPEYATFKRRNG